MKKSIFKPTVSVLGGDRRNEILADMLTESGFDTVYTNKYSEIINALNKNVIILPLPISRDGRHFNCEDKIKLVDIINKIHPHSRVLCGGLNDEIRVEFNRIGAKAIDYYNVEQVLKENAYLTAEGTVKIIIENTTTALTDNKILIIGNGRCADSLSRLLKKIGCEVAVTTRKSTFNLNALLNGIKLLNTAEISEYINDFDVIVNTAPSIVLDKELLEKIIGNPFIIELASRCAGLDISAADELGLNAIYAPALPGKYSPVSAARVLYKSINNIISEEFS